MCSDDCIFSSDQSLSTPPNSQPPFQPQHSNDYSMQYASSPHSETETSWNANSNMLQSQTGLQNKASHPISPDGNHFDALPSFPK